MYTTTQTMESNSHYSLITNDEIEDHMQYITKNYASKDCKNLIQKVSQFYNNENKKIIGSDFIKTIDNIDDLKFAFEYFTMLDFEDCLNMIQDKCKTEEFYIFLFNKFNENPIDFIFNRIPINIKTDNLCIEIAKINLKNTKYLPKHLQTPSIYKDIFINSNIMKNSFINNIQTYIPKECFQDKSFCEEIININPYLIKLINITLPQKIYIESLQKIYCKDYYNDYLQYVPEEIKMDDFYEILSNKCGLILKFLPEKFQTIENFSRVFVNYFMSKIASDIRIAEFVCAYFMANKTKDFEKELTEMICKKLQIKCGSLEHYFSC